MKKFNKKYMQSKEYQELMTCLNSEYKQVEYRELNDDEFPIVGTLEIEKVA